MRLDKARVNKAQKPHQKPRQYLCRLLSRPIWQRQPFLQQFRIIKPCLPYMSRHRCQGILTIRFVLLRCLEHPQFLRQVSVMFLALLLYLLSVRSEFHYASLSTFPVLLSVSNVFLGAHAYTIAVNPSIMVRTFTATLRQSQCRST
jgi:hypothetical protein